MGDFRLSDVGDLIERIKTPLTLSGFVVVVLYLLYNKVLSLGIFANLSENPTFLIINNIIWLIFWLAVISIIFGGIGYLIPIFARNLNTDLAFIGEINNTANISNLTIYQYIDGYGTQLERILFFKERIGIDNVRSDYSKAQLKAYDKAWRSLVGLEKAGDKLWDVADGHNLIKFFDELRETRKIIREGIIFIDQSNLDDLKKIIDIFSEFYSGKEKLLDLKDRIISMRMEDPSKHPEIIEQIDNNYQVKLRYGYLMRKIEDDFREKLSER